MKNYFQIRTKFQKYRLVFLVIILALLVLPAAVSLMRPGFFPMYDDMQVIRLEQLDKCIKDGQIPCRWVPDLGYGYGYPLFDYYAPLPYYFMEAFHLIGFSFVDSVKIGFVGSIFFSALFFFLLAKRFFKNATALLITFVYVMIPFRAADIYVRGAMGEAWGLALLPAYIWSFENFIKNKNIRSLGIFALFGGLFLISHNLTVLMSLPLLGIWFFLRLLSNKKLFKYALLSVIFSVCLSAFYVVPLFFGKNLVHIETTTQGYFNFVNHFSTLKQIFVSTHWGYGPSEIGAEDDAFVGIGPIHALLGVLGILAWLLSGKKKRGLFFPALFGLAIFYSFLMHQRSVSFWQGIPFMKYFQFPWRFSLAASFVFSFLAGLLFEKIPKLFKPIFYTLSVAIIILVYGNFFAPREWLDVSDEEKLSGEMRQRAVTASIYDYLPKSAKVNPAHPAPDSLIVESGEVDIYSSVRGTNWYKYGLNVETEAAEVVIPAYDFPGWKIDVNGKKKEYERFGELGLLSVKLEQGENKIKAELKKTPLKKAADAATLISLVFVLSLVSLKKCSRGKLR